MNYQLNKYRRNKLADEQGWLCYYCERPMVVPGVWNAGDGRRATLDRLRPRDHRSCTLAVCCLDCHARKGRAAFPPGTKKAALKGVFRDAAVPGGRA